PARPARGSRVDPTRRPTPVAALRPSHAPKGCGTQRSLTDQPTSRGETSARRATETSDPRTFGLHSNPMQPSGPVRVRDSRSPSHEAPIVKPLLQIAPRVLLGLLLAGLLPATNTRAQDMPAPSQNPATQDASPPPAEESPEEKIKIFTTTESVKEKVEKE